MWASTAGMATRGRQAEPGHLQHLWQALLLDGVSAALHHDQGDSAGSMPHMRLGRADGLMGACKRFWQDVLAGKRQGQGV